MTKKSVTMSDIAKVMNVSTVTVSKALGDRDGVSVELRERIKQKATEMGYRVHAGSHGAERRQRAVNPERIIKTEKEAGIQRNFLRILPLLTYRSEKVIRRLFPACS